MSRRSLLPVLAAALVLGGLAASPVMAQGRPAPMLLAQATSPAADPGQQPGTTPIKGESVMGDKGRSGPDGWSWAPVSRDDTAAKGTGKGQSADQMTNGTRPVAATTTSAAAGTDPGTPMATRQPGPSGMVASAPGK